MVLSRGDGVREFTPLTPAFDWVEDLMVRTIIETCDRLRCLAILMGLPGPDNRIALCLGLQEAARAQTRPDPLPRDLFGPIRQRLAESVTAKVRLLFAENRMSVPTAAGSAFRTPHSALRIPHSAFRIPHSAFRTPHSALRIPHSAFP